MYVTLSPSNLAACLGNEDEANSTGDERLSWHISSKSCTYYTIFGTLMSAPSARPAPSFPLLQININRRRARGGRTGDMWLSP